jgi:TolB-like protein
LIKEYRLEKAHEMLVDNIATVSEIAYKVGFKSPSYFNTCFHEFFGYPPGEVKMRFFSEDDEDSILVADENRHLVQREIGEKLASHPNEKFTRRKVILMSVIVVIAIILFGAFFKLMINDRFSTFSLNQRDKELSIIVLPFNNLTNNSENQHFAEGIREDILNNLYWVTAMRVVSRTSAEQFRDGKLSAREIARKMGVEYVLEGSIRRYGEKIRIGVQLIDAYRDDHLWSSNFDVELKDVIRVQDEIALQVASHLKVVLPENEVRQIKKMPTQNPIAYDYYLRGRFLLHRANSQQRVDFDKEGVQNCIKYYEMAITEDENFAEAYAGLANANFNLSAWGFLGSNEGFLKARNLCLKALELDPDCAEAHTILGAFLIWGQRNFEEGGKSLKTAILNNPNFATAHQFYAQYLMITGPIEDARFHINRALELEPYFWVIQNLDAYIYYFEGKNNEAINSCFLAQDLQPGFIDNEWLFVLNYAKLGEGEKAVDMLQKIIKHHPASEHYAVEVKNAYTQSGIKGLFTWLINVNKNRPIPIEGMNGHPFYIAWWNAILGNGDETIHWLEKNMNKKRRLYTYFNLIATNPDFDFIHDDPRFLKIVDEIGLSRYIMPKTR